MTRDQMMDNVGMRWGMEHDYVIDFCKIAENQNYTDSMVFNYYVALMSMPMFIEEDQ